MIIQKLANFNYTQYKIKALQCTYPNSRLQVQYQVRLYHALWSNIRYQVLGYSSRNYDDLSLLLSSLSPEYLEVMCPNNNINVCKFSIAREHWPGTLEYIIPMAGWWKKGKLYYGIITRLLPDSSTTQFASVMSRCYTYYTI